MCVDNVPDVSLITVDWEALRRSFVELHRDVLLTEERILGLSFEDGNVSRVGSL
jgi:hypothetical protein